MQLHEPELGIAYLDAADFPIAEVLLCHQIQHEAIAYLGVVAHALLESDILPQQLHHCDLSGLVVDAVIQFCLNLPGLLAKLLQIGIVDGAAHPFAISIAVLVDQILSLAFSLLQDTALVVFAFLTHIRTPLKTKGTSV